MSTTTATREAAGDYRRTVEYRAAKWLQPDIAIFLFGTNDAKWYNWNASAFEESYVQLVRSFNESGDTGECPQCTMGRGRGNLKRWRPPRVVLVVPPPSYMGIPRRPEYSFRNPAMVGIPLKNINEGVPLAVRRAAGRLGAELVDVPAVFSTAFEENDRLRESDLLCDGLHGSQFGNDLIAKAVFAALRIQSPRFAFVPVESVRRRLEDDWEWPRVDLPRPARTHASTANAVDGTLSVGSAHLLLSIVLAFSAGVVFGTRRHRLYT